MASTVFSNSQGLAWYRPSATAMPPLTNWTYVQDRDGITIIEPVVGFYFNPPVGAKCRWSTDNGRRKPQHLQFGLQLPRRNLVLWDNEKLDAETAFYREKYWEDMKTLTAPQRFEDLYEYFDSVTLWMHGAINLWNLINMLVADADTNWHEHEQRIAKECNVWVLDWLENFPAAQFNRESLMRWNQKTDILTAVTTQYDWTHDLRDLDMVSQNILRECFLFHFKRLTGKKPAVACFNHHAPTDTAAPASAQFPVPAPVPAPASARGPVIVTSDYAPENLPNGQPPLELGSPSSQGLATIPEHSSPARSSAKANGLTIDTIASTRIPKHTVSAPVTAAPQISVAPQAPGEAESEMCQHDGSDSTNDEFFNPRALVEQIEVKARQLSAQSAPEDLPESVPSASKSKSKSQKQDPVSRHAVPGSPTVAIPATNNNHDTDRPPSAQVARKGPRWNALDPRNGVTTVPTYQLSQQPLAQQGGPMGPTPHQHMMPPIGPHSGMQQPPAGFIPPIPPHPDAFIPQGPSLPGVGMPPMGPPGLAFQGQFPILPPGMDMPPFTSPQGQLGNAPPHYVAQQNVGTPMYQPNGYIAQPRQQQRQRGSFSENKQTKQTKQNIRRDSMNSNGSRKVRDDPLHGPVYAMNPRKNSNASSGSRRLSNAKHEHTPDGSRVACVNSWVPQVEEPFTQLFDECPCPRCLEASRSVYVNYGPYSVHEDTVRTSLMRYFSDLKPTGIKARRLGKTAIVIFKTDHDAVSAVQNFWSVGDKQTIPGLHTRTYVWYPLYSRHYTPRVQNTTGAPRGLVEARDTSRRLSGHSAQRRGSNPYLGQRPVFNNPDFGRGVPVLQQPRSSREQQQMNNAQPGVSHAGPYLPQPPQVSQRTLWKPRADDSRRKSSTAQSAKEKKTCSPKARPGKSVEDPVVAEDWRSKPASEEAIEDSVDEVAVSDTTSNVSSQGVRSIRVCLPVEAGPVRSRSVSPAVEDSPAQEQAEETSLEVEATPQEEPGKDEAPTTIGVETTVLEEDTKRSSSYNMATSDLAVAVEEFQPVVAPKQSQATEVDDQKTTHSYSKVTSELAVPTEVVDINTVIRHKPQKPRSPLPIEWDGSVTSTSELQGRFADLQDEFAPALAVGAPEPPADGTKGAGATAAAVKPTETAPYEEPQAKKPKKKGKGSKKKQVQATPDDPVSGPPSNTSAKTHSRGPSRASTGRPESRASNKRPQSAAGTTAESSSRPSSAMMQNRREDQDPVADGAPPAKRKKNKSYRKGKQTPTAEESAVSEGQAKTGGSQDQDRVHGRATSGQESPRKKPKTMHPRPEAAEKSSGSEPTTKATADGSRGEIGEQQAVSKDAGYRANAGGSLRLKKNRSPNKSQQKSDQENDDNDNKTPTRHEPKSLQTIFEPPSEGDRKYVSPDANLFSQQKFAIDQAKLSAFPKKMSLDHKENVKPGGGNTTKLTTNNNARIGSLPPGFNPYPHLPPNTKPSAWSTVAKRGVNNNNNNDDDDPFSPGQGGEDQSRNWMKDKAVRPTTHKPRGEDDGPAITSPTPSPDRKGPGHRGDKMRKQLNAAAKTFTPSSSAAPSVVSLRASTTAQVSAAAGHQDRAGSGSGSDSTTNTETMPRPVTAQPIPHHVKRPSLPGQKGKGKGDGADTRFITPAEQTLDPARVEQPGPPAKEKNKRAGDDPQQQQRQRRPPPTAAQVAGSAPGNDVDFPTLAASAPAPAPAPRRQAASFARAASASAAPTAAAQGVRGGDVRPTPSVAAPAVAAPDSVRPGQRGGVVSARVPTAPGPGPAGRDDWTTVGPGRKTTGGKNPTAGGGGSGGGKGGRSTQQGGGGGSGRTPVGEERRGG